MRIVPIVEGHGDSGALPVLLRRLLGADGADVQIGRPIRVPRGKLGKEEELRKAVDLAARHAGPTGGVIVVADADHDPACTAGPLWLGWARASRPDAIVSVVLAVAEYECWFLAAIESLRGHRGVRMDAEAVENPEGIRGAKERLNTLMVGRSYSETTDQPAMSQLVDMALVARRSPSFEKLQRDVRTLVAAMRARTDAPTPASPPPPPPLAPA